MQLSFTEIIWRFCVIGFTDIFSPAFFTNNIRRFYRDFHVCHKISVNFSLNLQEKWQDFTDILRDVRTRNALKFTDFL